ncbi:MAG: FtsX-like permease family protein [Trueperaceae bacterium]|nr:FtsX-like permease family protein [Trueperaceae bacterium]
MPTPLYLALAHVRRRGLQTTLTLGGVAVGVAVLITALSLTNGFIDELLSSTLRATPHVTLRTYEADGRTAARDDVEARLAAHPEVVAVAPFLAVEALIARRADATLGVTGRQGYTQLLGVDPAAQTAVLDLPALRAAGDALAAGGLVLGGSLGLSLGVLDGDEVLVQDIDGNRTRFEVASSFRVGNELIDGVASYASLATVQRMLDAPGAISGYHLRLTDPSRAGEVGRALAADVGMRAIPWSSLFGGLVTQLRLQKAVISVVVFLIVLVAAMGIANVLVLTVAEKTKEIAALRALGARERDVLATFTLEGLLLGGGGTLLGVGLGLAVSAYFRVQPFPLPGDLYFITRLPVEVAAFDVAWVAAVSLVTSAVAGLLPARRAARLDPSSVLR